MKYFTTLLLLLLYFQVNLSTSQVVSIELEKFAVEKDLSGTTYLGLAQGEPMKEENDLDADSLVNSPGSLKSKRILGFLGMRGFRSGSDGSRRGSSGSRSGSSHSSPKSGSSSGGRSPPAYSPRDPSPPPPAYSPGGSGGNNPGSNTIGPSPPEGSPPHHKPPPPPPPHHKPPPPHGPPPGHHNRGDSGLGGPIVGGAVGAAIGSAAGSGRYDSHGNQLSGIENPPQGNSTSVSGNSTSNSTTPTKNNFASSHRRSKAAISAAIAVAIILM